MFNRRVLFFTGLMLVAILVVGALVWFVGPRWGMGWAGMPMHSGMWSETRFHMRGLEGMMPHAGFGRMPFGWGGMIGFGLFRLMGWLLQIGLIVAIVMWLLRRTAPPMQPLQSAPSATPSEPTPPAQS